MTPGTVVHKFGGAALADVDAIRAVGMLVLGDTTPAQRVIVTSALLGVTNTLVQAIAAGAARTPDAHAAAMAFAGELRERHDDLAGALLADARHELAQARSALAECSVSLATSLSEIAELDDDAALTDAVLAFGERAAAALVAAHLRGLGLAAVVVDGAAVIATDSRHGNAAPDSERTAANAQRLIAPRLANGEIVVVPGFIGLSGEGKVTTLGRGGSDLSAAVLARAIGATEVVLWKDVPGFMTADPRVVRDARVVPVLDAREASELAYYGAKVLHPRTLLPLAPGTTLWLRPFADPSAAGTRVVVGKPARGAPVRALSGMGRQAMIAVNGKGMLGVPGVAARVFGALAANGVSVSLISQASSEQSICFTVPAERAAQVVELMREEFSRELERGEIEEVTVRSTLVTIAVVGSGMANTPGIAARIFDAVAHAGVNVVAIAQGASERNISFVVDEAQSALAMRAVHDAFNLGKVGSNT